MKKKNLSLLFFLITLSSLLYAKGSLPKQALKTNGLLLYNTTQKSAENLKEMFNKGEFFGRIRTNNCYYNYKEEDSDHKNSLVGSIGGSFVYKSASLNHFDFTLGLYGSQAFFDPNEFDNNVKLLKSAKDLFSRYKYAKTGSKTLYTFAQANIRYRYSKTDFLFGRQLVETFYTKSNDTKMVPNTFDGFTITSKDFAKKRVKFAYLVKEKLRNHEDAHALFMYNDSDMDNYSNWSGNDDGAMHRGISYTNLIKAGKPTDAPLIIFDIKENSLKNLTINFSSYLVPSLISQCMGELNYKIDFDKYTIIPAVRYIQQFDNGAGAVGGASLVGDVNTLNSGGYKDPNSLNAQMIAARIVVKKGDCKINLAYTDILDRADLVTPWRGFPTAGYTRSMGIYNWRANTKSYRLEITKGTNPKGVYIKPFLQASLLYIESDTKKSIFENSLYYYFGIIQNSSSMPQLQYRFRIGYRDFISESANHYSNYTDSRFEIDYLF